MFGLSFLFPAFLVGSAAAAVPIVLHLFKRQAEPRISFSAVRFLRRAPVEQSRRRKLRELLLLALRVTAVALLALAFARPYLAGAAALGSGPATIVAVDTSLSMSAPGVFDRARRLARDAVSRAPSGHLVGVVSFADSAELVAPPSSDRGAALAAIDRLKPGPGATRYRVALARAAEAIGSRAGRIVVATDLQESGWDSEEQAAVPARVGVEVADAGGAASNLAVTGLRRDPNGAVAVIRNAGTLPRSGRAWLSVDGRRVADTTFTAPAGLSAEARFGTPLPASGVASAGIEDSEGYETDNTRYLLLDPPEPAELLAVTTGGKKGSEAFYLERALSVADESKRFQISMTSAEDFSAMAPADLGRFSATLLLGTRGLERRGRETLQGYVRGGGGLFIAAGPDVEPDVLQGMFADHLRVRPPADEVAPLAFTPADARHPIFRSFGASAGNLGRVRFARAVRIDEREAGRVIGRFDDGTAALVEYEIGSGRVLFFASDLNYRWNDFPLHPVFVPFVHEVALYLTARPEASRAYVVADVPAGLSRQPGVVVIPAPRGTGGAQRNEVAVAGRRAAVNVDVRESEIGRITPEQFSAAITRLNDVAAVQARSEARQQEDHQRLWQYGLILMVVGLVAEGMVGARMG